MSSVISATFFEMHGLGEKVVYLHGDNCTGQNKKQLHDTLPCLGMIQLNATSLNL